MKKKYFFCLFYSILLITGFYTNRVIAQKSSFSISNERLTATILKKGAELASLKSKTMEYIWQADPKFWNRHAPILFPIVGPLKDKEYFFNSKTYSLPQHGFARDYDFKVVHKTQNSITFEQRATPKTKKMYPFNYVLQVKYTLKDTSLKVTYTVINSDSQNMYFSIGAHPAFNCPFEKEQKRSDYTLIFDKQVLVKTKNKKGKFYVNDYSEVMSTPGQLQITDSLFNKGSLTFNPNPFSSATFVHNRSGKKYLKVSFKNFPYLGIWSAGNSPFVCIEPWHGIADNYDHNKKLVQKEGVMSLKSYKVFHCSFTIKVFD